ncbi:MAG: hypothetical protein JW994_02845 [Candidatus Omnitrophica bacterium]|nr:hypothetical protein [Candidatus Omnitrophota bacterium]
MLRLGIVKDLAVIFKELFMYYVNLTGFAALLAFFIGLFATIAGIVMLIFRMRRIYIHILFIIAILPIVVGFAGTMTCIEEVNDTASLEKKVGLTPTAERYYDLEYGYAKYLLYSFPVMAGCASAIPPLFIVVFLYQKNSKKNSKK